MIEFTATILKFSTQGEKTGWTYINIPQQISLQLKPGKKSFRVKGYLDSYAINGLSLIPIGGGDFILPLNAALRKGLGKTKGAMLNVKIEADDLPVLAPIELLECLADEPNAQQYFQSLTKGHQNYFIKWIETAKTGETKAKRIAQAVTALSRKMDFGAMIRAAKEDRSQMFG